MTQSDQSGQDGPARRGVGRPAATETVDKSGRAAARDANGAANGRSATGGAAKQPDTRASRSAGPGAASPAAGGATQQRTPARGAAAGSSRPASREAAARKPRRARLRLTQVDAWTVMKTSFLLSIALGIVSVVAVAIVWIVLGAAGVFDSMNDTVQTLLGNDFRVQDYIGTGRILGFTMILAVVDVVLLTAIATLAAFLYNLAATLLGGVEVTLTEDS